jgi:hypothetical protein
MDGTASTVAVGTSADADVVLSQLQVSGCGTTRGTLDTEATDVGTTDVQVLATLLRLMVTARGVATVTILYIQNR